MTRIPRAGIAIVLAVAWPVAVAPPPAGAHAGGRAQLYVDSVHLEPRADGWLATLVVRDADSGEPQPGFGVLVTGSTADGRGFGPVDVTDPDADGRYATSVPLTEGPWSLTIEATGVPGGPRAVPFEKTWQASLQAGHPLDLAGSRPSSPGRRSGTGRSATPLVLGLTAAAALAGVAVQRRSIRS